MTELEAELRRLAGEAAETDYRDDSAGAAWAFNEAADLARDHEAAKGEGGWLPIESAPRDGTCILTLWEGMWYVAWWNIGCRRWDSVGQIDVGAEYWRPLPEPPVAEGVG